MSKVKYFIHAFHRQYNDSLKINLRTLILYLVIFSVASLFLISLAVSYYIQKKQLIENSLSLNYDYAHKVSLNTDQQFKIMLDQLAYSANILGKNFDNQAVLQAEVARLKNQSSQFNSVLVFDYQGKIKEVAPPSLTLKKNMVLHTLGVEESLKVQKTYISPPYYSATKNLIVLMTQPIFDQNRKYLGFVTGSIYLKKNNIISELLTIKYSYKDGYMYVIDNNNRIIFHPERARIGETVVNNTGLAFMNQTSSGKIRLINSRGIDNLAGFARVPSTNWIVVSQQPTESLLAQARSILYKVGIGIFLFYLLVFFIVWRLSRFISAPLHSLAKTAGNLNSPDAIAQIEQVNPWYYEVYKFKLSLLLSTKNFNEKVTELNFHVNTDPLTGLYNRRGMDLFTNELLKQQTRFSVIAIDIDFFKKINDHYGHDQGDLVLQKLAQIIKENFREDDICCRVGGEEFIVITPRIDIQQAYLSAERLQQRLTTTLVNGIGPITVSIGLSFWSSDTSTDIKHVLKEADRNLYRAKLEGRNCIRYTDHP